MFDKDLYHVIHSPLSQDITRDDRTVRASIYDDGEGKWILEVEDEYGNSSVWDQHFDTDRDALNEAYRTIQEEGITSLIGKPSSTDEPKLRVGLSDEELDELSAFLMSEDTSDETMMLDTLDGFLTAIVSVPVTLLPSQWLPRVWGPSPNDEPAFETIDQAMHITGLIMRHMNGIIANLQWEDDQELQPIFDVASYPDDSN